MFFESWTSYHLDATEGCAELYKNVRAALAGRLQGRVCHIGSAGVVDYDLAEVTRVMALDLSRAPNSERCDARVVHTQADARALPFAVSTFDRVVIRLVIHHLAEDSVRATEHSVLRCLIEARRVLRAGGRLMIVESCVPRVVEVLEDVGYQVVRRLVALLGHPMVKQFTLGHLTQMVERCGFGPVAVNAIDTGPHVIQMGVRVPARLSPVRVFLLDAVAGG